MEETPKQSIDPMSSVQDNTAISDSQSGTGEQKAVKGKKNHTKLVVFIVGVVVVSGITFGAMTIFMSQTVEKTNTATTLPKSRIKTGTIQEVDALIKNDLSDESTVSDATSQDVTNTITGSLEQTQLFEEEYNGF
jgi:uncharacterized protein HemX